MPGMKEGTRFSSPFSFLLGQPRRVTALSAKQVLDGRRQEVLSALYVGSRSVRVLVTPELYPGFPGLLYFYFASFIYFHFS